MASDNRSEGRSNVFLAATLSAGARQIPVRIRNISTRGALIEGSGLPSAGSQIGLMRGPLSIAGHLAWEGNRAAGLNFDSEIVVADWVRGSGHGGQQRVDQVVAALRASSKIPAAPPEESQSASLAAISAALERICERLASHPGMSIELGEELVEIDTIAQILRKFAAERADEQGRKRQ